MNRALPKAAMRVLRFPFAGMLGLVLAAAAQAADPTRGGTLYASHCAICHGAQGQPVWPGTPDFRRAGALMKPDAQLLATLRIGRGVMPAYQGILRDKDMHDVMAYLRTLGS